MTGRRRIPRRSTRQRYPLYWWPSLGMWVLVWLHLPDGFVKPGFLPTLGDWWFWGAFAVYVLCLVFIGRPNGIYGRNGDYAGGRR